MPFINKIDDLEFGKVSWENSEDVPLSDIGSLLNKPKLHPTYSASDLPLIISDGRTKTLVFVANEDMTLEAMVIDYEIASYDYNDTADFSHITMISRFEIVSGTGPDVSKNLVIGNSAASLGPFSINNIGISPYMNLRLAAGDQFEIDIHIDSDIYEVPRPIAVPIFFTYKRVINYFAKPIRILTSFALEDQLFVDTSTSVKSAASSIITVLTPFFLGSITFYRIAKDVDNENTATITAGDGSPGSNTYDETIFGTVQRRNDLVDKLNNVSNDFAEHWTFSNGVDDDQIVVTCNNSGVHGNFNLMRTSLNSGYKVIPFAGGSTAKITKQIATPSENLVLKNIFYLPLDTDSLNMVIKGLGKDYDHGFELSKDILINDVPSPIGSGYYFPMNALIGNKKINTMVLSGQTIKLQCRSTNPSKDYKAYFTVIAEEA